MLLAFSIAPSTPDAGGSYSASVAKAVQIVRDSGLPNHTDAMFTTIEGDWDECLAVVKACVDALSEGDTRVGLVMKADIRPGHTGQLTAKVERVEEALRRTPRD